MRLNIKNEFGSLKSVVVCFGEHAPDWETHKNNDPEFLKYHTNKWDKRLLLKQQAVFFKLLESYKIKLVFPATDMSLPHQMFTRDAGFVIGDKLFYSKIRNFGDRTGEDKYLLKSLDLDGSQIVEIEKEIEGGDVLIAGENSVFVGCGSRTHKGVGKILEAKQIKNKLFDLGTNVMHLDTKLTLLPNNHILINPEAFCKNDMEYLNKNYRIIEANEFLGTNVFMINPETIVVAKQHPRIAEKLREAKFNVEIVDYSEPINLCGSFRCTTMPLERED